jgi:hypothetical protein
MVRGQMGTTTIGEPCHCPKLRHSTRLDIQVSLTTALKSHVCTSFLAIRWPKLEIQTVSAQKIDAPYQTPGGFVEADTENKITN